MAIVKRVLVNVVGAMAYSVWLVDEPILPEWCDRMGPMGSIRGRRRLELVVNGGAQSGWAEDLHRRTVTQNPAP